LNKQTDITVDIYYYEQNVNRIRITIQKSESSNTIDFKYENLHSNQLKGIITLYVLIDPITENKDDDDLLPNYVFELEFIVI
jgi:hypothetical protein